jgi:adenylate cyclase
VLPLLAPNAVLNDLPPTQWGVIRGGIINFNQDSDQVGRHYWLYLTHAGWRIDSLPARVASDLGWPLPDQPEIRLNWRQTPPHFSYADLYFDSQREHPKLAPDLLRNKVIVIGARAPGLQDLRPTPLSAVYPGSDILATALDNLRAGDWLRERPRSAMLPLAMGLVVLLAWAFARGVSVARVGYALAAGSLACMAFGFWQLRQGTWWPVFSPLVYGWGAYWLYALRAYLHERAERERTVRLFQRFLDPRVVRGLVETGEIDMAARPQSREITVLFSDIRGFTTLSETRAPEYIVDLLNRYFTDQVAIVRKHGGTLDKFIGDAIMAFWGAPVSDPDHARHAVAAAIEMAEALERFKAELGDIGHDFDIGIGLNSGPAVVGFIGSEDRLDYTAIGDTVNLASRIEGQTKGVARVLIADATRRLAGEDFTYRDCGDHHVKGREQAVRLFEPARRKTTHETPHGEENKP